LFTGFKFEPHIFGRGWRFILKGFNASEDAWLVELVLLVHLALLVVVFIFFSLFLQPG
jgi:hypothetical protein